MRLSELFAPAAAKIVFIALSIRLVTAVSFNPVPPPNLDLSQQGRIALAGDFDSISLYTYEGQNQNGFSTNGSQSLLQQLPNGVFATLNTSDAMIMAMCPFIRQDGTLAGIVVGGNFTSLGGLAAQGAALMDPVTNQITALPGLSGSVNALYCDQDRDTVFVGGDFQGLNSTNAIAWVAMDGWANMPFAGFNRPVTSISKAPNGNIIWGGSFSGLGNMTTPSGDQQQVINLQSANISAEPSTSREGFSNPRNVVCSSGEDGPNSTWLTSDTVGAVDFNFGFWRADFRFGFEPKKLRIYNTHQDGRGTSSFRFRALPINGIMNFTYTDPDTGNNATCANFCPLSNDTSIPYQDFTFVNTVGMNAFQIDIRGIYGNGGGFNGIELFQDDIYTYAVSDINEPACANIDFPSNSTSNGPWTVATPDNSASPYLNADLNGADTQANSDVGVTFFPDIRQDGNYSVTIFTPGCEQDNSCERRGRANITIIPTADGQNVDSQMIYQTNDFDKYDQIYMGPVDASSDSFRPQVIVTPWNEEPRPQSLVALRVRFMLLDPSSSGLNGIYEYDPDQAGKRLEDSVFNAAGEDLEPRALVNTLTMIDGTTYVGGNFSNQNLSNVFAIPENGNITALAGRGLNNAVNHFFAFGNQLFVGGNFTDTIGTSTANIKHVAWYDVESRTWSPLGGGVNGPVERIVPLTLNTSNGQPETCITVSGHFDQVLDSGNNPSFAAPGFAIWVPSAREWLQNTGIQSLAIQGQLTAATNITDLPPLLAGTIQSQGWALSDAVALSAQDGNVNIAPIGLRELPAPLPSNKLRKRDITNQNFTGAVTGLFVTDNDRNITVLAGHFEAVDSDDNTIHNVALISTEQDGRLSTRGLAEGIEENSTFYAVSRTGNTLSLGGQVSGTASGRNVSGFVQWDIESGAFVQRQPPGLDGDEVAVYSITTRPEHDDEIYVGGSFSGSRSFPCPSLCVYTGGQWERPGQDIEGTVSNMVWQGNDRLLVAGNLTIANNDTFLGTYLVENQQWSIPDNANTVPGPVTALTPANGDASQYWISGNEENGNAYLIKFDGTFRVVSSIFGQGTKVRGLSVVSTSEDNEGNEYLERRLALMVTGTINIPNFGNASAALFNGTTLTPLILSNSGNNQGSISQIIAERQQSFRGAEGGMRVGYVVAIALAIALGVMGLIILAGLIIERRRRQAEGYRPAPQNYFEKTANMGRIPPERLFSSLNQPTTPRIGN